MSNQIQDFQQSSVSLISVFPSHKSTYVVTIECQGSMYIAYDNDGNWRTRGDANLCNRLVACGECNSIAACLFHAEEIESVEKMADGSEVAVIREW